MRITFQGPPRGAVDEFIRQGERRLADAALIASDRASQQALRQIRTEMSGAKLGRLGSALDAGSDLSKGTGVRRTATGFSAFGYVFIRSRSPRTLGALEAYTQGANIVPRRGGYLWIASDKIPARVGRYRMTPERYRAAGLETRLGPLIQIPGRRQGEVLLIVKSVTTRLEGRSRTRPLPKSGKVSALRQAHDYVIAFIGIRRTSRAARINPARTLSSVQASLPRLIAAAGDL